MKYKSRFLSFVLFLPFLIYNSYYYFNIEFNLLFFFILVLLYLILFYLSIKLFKFENNDIVFTGLLSLIIFFFIMFNNNFKFLFIGKFDYFKNSLGSLDLFTFYLIFTSWLMLILIHFYISKRNEQKINFFKILFFYIFLFLGSLMNWFIVVLFYFIFHPVLG